MKTKTDEFLAARRILFVKIRVNSWRFVFCPFGLRAFGFDSDFGFRICHATTAALSTIARIVTPVCSEVARMLRCCSNAARPSLAMALLTHPCRMAKYACGTAGFVAVKAAWVSLTTSG